MKHEHCHPVAPRPAQPSRLRSITAARFLGAAVACCATLGSVRGQLGTNYCTAVRNSTGATASITGLGSNWVSLDNFALYGSFMPTHTTAFFLCSRTQAFVPAPGGSAGNLCLGPPIGRVVGGAILNTGNGGYAILSARLSAMPQPGGAVAVQAGETWNFQCWYRDAAAGGATASNFSDGLSVYFTTGPSNPPPGMVAIPPGTFLMGSAAPNGSPYFNDASQQPVHQVTITYPFWMGRYEVTQAEYAALMGTYPSFHLGVSSRPVESVSWHDARAYCAALNAQQAGNLPPGYEYRLPTEAEWEYACRAGSKTEFHSGDALFCDQAKVIATYHAPSPGACTHPNEPGPVGSYAPNAFGLYDMHGNVMEWCLDSYAPYSSAAVTDPFVTGGVYRIRRGGAWIHYTSFCRSAYWFKFYAPVASYFDAGFRVVLAPVLVP